MTSIEQTPGESSGPALLRLTDVSVTYGRVQGLRNLSVELSAGGLLLVLGPNGAGKSSLMRAVAGVVGAGDGRIELDGENLTGVAAHRRVAKGISLVPEGRGTLPGLSVRDNLELGWSAAAPIRRGSQASDIAEVLELFPRLADRLRQDCSTLSGGEMQMLAIARALLAKPKVLLLDEPSLGLAPQVIERIYSSLAGLNEGGLAMVIVEQKAVPLNRAPELTLVLQSGRILARQVGARPTDAELAQMYLGEVATA